MTSSDIALPGPNKLISNTAWNVVGQLLPLAVGILTLPLLIRLVGLERFGFISLVWVLVGYASVFDFGISRALIRVVAANLARGDAHAARIGAQAGQFYLLVFGVAVALLLAMAGNWIAFSVAKLPSSLLSEAVPAMYLLAASLPFVMLTTGYVGILSAYGNFKELNLIKLAMGMASYLGPVAVAYWSPSLQAVVGFVLLMRILGTFAHAAVCVQKCKFKMVVVLPQPAASKELFSLGGWMAVSNIVSPALSYLDRLLIAALVPMRAVAFYGTPYDVISKVMILPYSIMAAVFPMATSVEAGSVMARQMLADSIRLLFVMMFLVILPFVALAYPILHAWLGAEFAAEAAPVLKILAVGVLLNALAQGPATLIQAAGKPSWMAKLHLIELPFFILLLWILTSRYGIAGTALATAFRFAIDAAAVYYLARRGVASGEMPKDGMPLASIVATMLLGMALPVSSWTSASVVLVLGLPLFIIYAWFFLLKFSERLQLVDAVKRRL